MFVSFSLVLAHLISIFSFSIYGLMCFFALSMRNDFHRFGLGHLRILTGALQILAVLGQILGFFYTLPSFIASSGLVGMMVVALKVRATSRDPWKSRAPALGFLLLNLFIVISMGRSL